MQGGVPEADASAVSVGHGWQTVKRAQWYGRWPRYAVAAVVVVFLGLGVRSVFAGPRAAPPVSVSNDAADVSSEDFAMQFARSYLSYDAARPQERNEALAPFVGESLQENGGFTARAGSQTVEWVDVASDQRALAGGRVITVAAAVSGNALPLYLAVPVVHRSGQPLELGGYPSLVGAPAVASAPPLVAGPEVEDERVKVVVDRVLRNYLAGDAPDLKADLTPDAQVTLPTMRLGVEQVERLEWVGRVGSGAVVAMLQATDESGASYTLSYELGVVNHERPYVDFVEVVPTDG